MKRRLCLICAIAAVLSGAWLVTVTATQSPRPLTADERREIDSGLRMLQNSLGDMGNRPGSELADAAIFQKGLTWALRYDREFTEVDVALLRKAISRGQQRAEALAAGKQPWRTEPGKTALGYVSRVDGSVQPYGVIVPRAHDTERPTRL